MTVVEERLKTGQGVEKPGGMVEGLVQAACTARMEKKAEAQRAAAATAPIRKDFLRCDIGGDLVIIVGYVGLDFLWARYGRQRRDTGSAGRWIDGRDVHRGGAFRLAVLLQGQHGEVMGSSGRQSDAGVHRGAGALVDEGIVSKYFHRADGTGEA